MLNPLASGPSADAGAFATTHWSVMLTAQGSANNGTFEKTEGIAQGRKLADYVFDHLFLPRHH